MLPKVLGMTNFPPYPECPRNSKRLSQIESSHRKKNGHISLVIIIFMTSRSSSNQPQYEDESPGYRPESTSTAFETTPEQRSERLYAFSEGSKKRVDRACQVAELAGPRSIVTNTHLAVDYAHVIPRATPSALVSLRVQLNPPLVTHETCAAHVTGVCMGDEIWHAQH